MRRVLGVCIVLLLAVLLVPSGLSAQQAGSERANRLGQNYPNPFNPTTFVPFTIVDEDLVGGRPAVVSIYIKDILGRLVANPAAMHHPNGDVVVENLEYTMAGPKLAYWDGTDKFGRKVASGTYLLELVVNGERVQVRKIVVNK
jgi:ABC-type dipeptide/oligopeptide/nickel transport system permease subunit